MDKDLVGQSKQKLEREKERLEKELSSFAEPDEKMKYNWNAKYPNRENGSMEEEADEVQEYDNRLSLEHNLELRLKEVESALEKMKGGKYGLCEKCAKEIERERLMAYPEARLCMECNKNS